MISNRLPILFLWYYKQPFEKEKRICPSSLENNFSLRSMCVNMHFQKYFYHCICLYILIRNGVMMAYLCKRLNQLPLNSISSKKILLTVSTFRKSVLKLLATQVVLNHSFLFRFCFSDGARSFTLSS